MAIFNEQSFGKKISKELSDYFKLHTTIEERKKIATNQKVSFSTIQKVVIRKLNVTENNMQAILDLLKLAIENNTKKVNQLNKQAKSIKKNLNI